MKNGKFIVTAIALASGAIAGMAHAQATPEQLQKALTDARQAAEKAQAAATAAEEVLARVQAAAKTQSSAQPTATTAASPPSGISLTGNIDVGLRATTNTDGTKSKTELINNNASTSLIWFKGNKVLSDNLNASFLLELDLNDTQSSTTNGTATSNAFTGTPFNGEQYVALSGGFGDIKLGTPNASGLTAAVTAQPFATALGSGYSGTFGRLGTASVSGINQFIGALSGRIIRHEKTVMYTTPGFNGWTASAEYALGNDNATAVTGNTNAYSSLALRYNRGPWNAIYSYTNEKAGGQAAAGPTSAIGTPPVGVLPVGTRVTWNFLAANYTFGSATIYGGYSSTEHNAAKPLESSSSWNIAGKYVLSPKIWVMGNYVTRNSRLATTPNANMLGLGVNYLLDNNTIIYGRYEGSKSDALGTIVSQAQNTWAVGVQYKF